MFFLSVRLLEFSMHQTQIHIMTFSRTESQHAAPCHPHVISNEYIFFPLSLSLPVLGNNHLSFQEPFSYICCREMLHYPSWLSFLLSGVSARNRPAGDSQTQKHITVNRHTHIFSWKRATDLRMAALKPNWQKCFFTSVQIILYYASGEVLMLIYCTSQ